MFKEGYKTTEFWVAVTLSVIGLIIAVVGLTKGGWVAVAALPAGCFQMGWVGGHYVKSRSAVKTGSPTTLNPAQRVRE